MSQIFVIIICNGLPSSKNYVVNVNMDADGGVCFAHHFSLIETIKEAVEDSSFGRLFTILQ
jgi:hypothetical protein